MEEAHTNNITLRVRNHGNGQWCWGLLKVNTIGFVIKPKEGFRKEQFWKEIEKVNKITNG